jgi:hypothetical protein
MNLSKNDYERQTTNLIRSLFDHVENQLARVDEKAELTVTANAILIAATALSNTEAIATILDNHISSLCRITALIQLLMLISFLASFYYSFRAVIPRLDPTKRKRNLFDFGYIIQLSEDEFVDQFIAQEDHEIYSALLSEIHTLSRIAINKYTHLRHSFIYLLAAFTLWALSQLLAHTCLP